MKFSLALVSTYSVTVHLKDAEPNQLQLFLDKLPAYIKGKIAKKIN